jgi:phage repressor protein C with HTH and peptisase S24 domain
METVIKRLEFAMRKAGLANKAEVARLSGIQPVTMRSYFAGHAHPPLDKCQRIGHVLGVSGEWLFTGRGNPEDVKPLPLEMMPVPLVTGAYLIPVYGTAVGGEDGRFDLNGSVVDRVAAPPGLQNVKDAYAVMVVGDSMEPRYEAGETVYVHPGKPVQRNGYVVVQLWPDADGEPVCGMVKRFIRMTDARIILEQFNPPKQIEIDRARVKAVHRIVLGGE